MSRQKSRRDFLRNTTMAGVGFWVAGRAAAEESKAANERIRFACIGIDGKGRSDSNDARRHGDVVAICDIDDNKLNKAAGSFPSAAKYNDFRKLLEEMGPNIDAVTVSTPDHTHAAASIMAMKMGKACFTQKPLTHSLFEARRMGEVAREMKVATQMGNQGTASRGLREAASVVKAGALGTVKEVHVWTNRPIWPQGKGRPPEVPIPEFVHWDLWLGPAPYRPYGEGYHPFSWRGYWDFGTGALGDMACHTLNMPYMALDLQNPTSVEAQTSGHNKEMYPAWSIIRYEFPATDKRPALTMTWHDGGKKPSIEQLGSGWPAAAIKDGPNGDKAEELEVSVSGALLIGDKGRMYSPGDYAEKYYLLEGASKPNVDKPPGRDHFGEFADAVKSGSQATSNFPNYSGPLTEIVLLGNLAVWSGKKVEWDAKNLKATNAPELDAIIRPAYREGYTL
ncbi:MAG: Gfo/Idh/MocA family oxidoreductase [Planctomycetia bacterium]|nr:Gfo/Idh/MocA family oxidoreductase [Planctomycetia bacterium]